MYDITLLTDPRYLAPEKTNPYIDNVLHEDELVINALSKKGFKVNRVAWDDPNFDFGTSKYALIRAVWDYFDRYEEFSKWFQKTAQETTFINSKRLIDWNIDKHYLQDLQQNGVNIPATLFIESDEQLSLSEAIDKAKQLLGFKTESFVLKPCVAGGARHTYKFHHSEVPNYSEIFTELILNEAMMLQEFQKSIVVKGEVSMMVFDGTFTHAVLKKAKKGDFRVQDDWGGTVENYTPTQAEIAFAEKVVKACPKPPIYARVDIFEDNQGQLALAELEIFEPELWFRIHPSAADTLANAIMQNYFS